MADPVDVPRLDLEYVIGFAGGIPNGLKVHPDRQHLIYSLGNTVIIENIETKKQQTLMGHSADVSCLAVSNTGKYIASGQVIHMGFIADIIIWDYDRKELRAKLSLHKVKIEALVFSPQDTFLLSLGGQDDGSVVVWDVATASAICGSTAQLESAGNTVCLAYHETDEYKFFTGGDRTLRVWELNVENRKIKPSNVVMGQYERFNKCIQMSGNYLLCGTTTGDILGVNVETKLFQFHGPGGGHNSKKMTNFRLGVTALAHFHDKQMMLVGSGEGEVALMAYTLTTNPKTKKNVWVFEKKRSWFDENSKEAVTSIALRGQGQQFYVGMANSQIYRFNFADFSCELIKSSHCNMVTDVVFPAGTNQLFVTSQMGQIRCWLLKNGQELLRQSVANMTCTSIALTRDGRMLFSAWSDGKIRGFAIVKGEKSGHAMKLKFVINDAHSNGVTALACTADGHCIISGGGEGQVRVWSISDDYRTTSLEHNMMEHKGSVADIKISKNNLTCVSASHDGTTIIWNLEKRNRSQIVFATTLFKSVVYNGEETQIVTSGTDRKLAYWDVMDGSQVRELDGSLSGSINAMDITEDGKVLVTGGDDKLIKLWSYSKGEVKAIGIGHSGNIQRIKIAPGNTHIVSVSADGAILVWKFPKDLLYEMQEMQEMQQEMM